MNINFLKYFHDVVELKSVSKASKLNFVSQAAISQGISKLESSLEVELMHHKKNAISITQHGEFIFQHSKPIFQSIQNFKMMIESYKPNDHQKIRIGTSQSLATIFFPKVLKIFKQKYPSVSIELKLGKTNDIKNLILEEKVDFGIVVGDLQHREGLDISILHKGHFRIYRGPKENNQVYVTESRPEVESFKNHSKANQVSYEYQQIESWSVIYQLCKNGLGMGLLPDFMLQKPLQFEPVFPYEIISLSKHTFNSELISDFYSVFKSGFLSLEK